MTTCSKPKRLGPGSRPPGTDGHEVGPAGAGVLPHEQVDPLDKRRGEDTIFRNGGSEGPQLMAGISGWQQPLREERCDGYAALLVSAPCRFMAPMRRVC